MTNKTLNGLFFRDFYNDHVTEIFKEIFFERLYDPYIGQGDTVVDVGANQGYFTYWAYLKKAAHIYAVEPSYDHYDALQSMIVFNHLEDIVTPINAAVSNFTGEGEFYHNENTTMYSLKAVVGQSHLGTESVRVLNMKDLISTLSIGDHIDLLKIDTEGSEFDIMTSPEFAEVSPIIKRVIVEHHQWTGTSPAQLVTLMSDLGFRVKQLPTQATVLVGER